MKYTENNCVYNHFKNGTFTTGKKCPGCGLRRQMPGELDWANIIVILASAIYCAWCATLTIH